MKILTVTSVNIVFESPLSEGDLRLYDEIIVPTHGVLSVRKITFAAKDRRIVIANFTKRSRTLRQRTADLRFATRTGKGWWR